MSVLGTAALIGAGITAASGIASGVGTAIGAKKERERIDDEIERIRRNRGLTAAEKSRFEAAATAEAAGIERRLQAEQGEALAAQAATGGAVSGRDIFLREQARQQARTEAAVEAGQREQMADLQRRAEQAARISQLEGLRSQAEQRRIGGIVTAVTGGLAGGAALAQRGVQQADLAEQRAFDLQLKLAELGKLDDEEVRAASGAAANPYEGKI
jgi:hypothetical protein